MSNQSRSREYLLQVLYSDAEWKSVYQVVMKKQPPKEPPSLLEMTKLIAQLGGYVNRKNAKPPGPQTVWLGLQAMH